MLCYPDFTKPFILATEASNTALGVVLSQCNEDGEHPVAYASRLLKGAELNYSATEKEMLGVVWGIKYFRCYLYGRKFTVLTDHAAIKWSFSVKDPSSRLVRWQMLLSEFEYEVVHKPGKLHINADVLSRAVRFTQGRVMEELSRGKVLEEQGRDEYCKKISDNEEFRRDDEGLLFRVKEKKWQLVVPRTLIKRVKKLVHSDR